MAEIDAAIEFLDADLSWRSKKLVREIEECLEAGDPEQFFANRQEKKLARRETARDLMLGAAAFGISVGIVAEYWPGIVQSFESLGHINIGF